MSHRDTMSVRQSVRAALGGAKTVVLAISGGLDSAVLLDAAAATVPPDRVIVATFDHGTGPAATSAARTVERLAAVHKLRCVCGCAATPLDTEAELRDARWEFLRDVAARHDAAIATAHTLDDQVETILMRVMRGAGARGVAALYAESDVVRPLLRLRRRQLASYARAQGLSWVDDPTNVTPKYARNRARHDLLPAMRRAASHIEDDLLAVARKAARWRDEVDAFIDGHLDVHVLATGLDVRASPLQTLSETETSVVWPAIAARTGLTLDRRGIARLAEFTRDGRVGSCVQLSGGWIVVRSRDAFEVRPSPAGGACEPATEAPIELSEEAQWGGWHFRRGVEAEVSSNAWSAWLPNDAELTVRQWRAGDAMIASEGSGARKVKHFLSDAGVTGHRRTSWPVVLAGDEIVWIPGVRRGATATARPGRPGLPFVCEYDLV